MSDLTPGVMPAGFFPKYEGNLVSTPRLGTTPEPAEPSEPFKRKGRPPKVRTIDEVREQVASKPIAIKPEQPATEKQEGGDHYKTMAIQPVEYIFQNKIGYLEGSVIKYVSRWKNKNGIEDLRKARHFIDLLIELEGKAK